MKGYVYALENTAMPGLIKIGRSKNGGHSRAASMYKCDTGVPLPFSLIFECLFDDCIVGELAVHDYFKHERVNPSREFFMIDEQSAVMGIMNAKGEEIGLITTEAEMGLEESQIHCLSRDLGAHPFEVVRYINNALYESGKDIVNGGKSGCH